MVKKYLQEQHSFHRLLKSLFMFSFSVEAREVS